MPSDDFFIAPRNWNDEARRLARAPLPCPTLGSQAVATGTLPSQRISLLSRKIIQWGMIVICGEAWGLCMVNPGDSWWLAGGVSIFSAFVFLALMTAYSQTSGRIGKGAFFDLCVAHLRRAVAFLFCTAFSLPIFILASPFLAIGVFFRCVWYWPPIGDAIDAKLFSFVSRHRDSFFIEKARAAFLFYSDATLASARAGGDAGAWRYAQALLVQEKDPLAAARVFLAAPFDPRWALFDNGAGLLEALSFFLSKTTPPASWKGPTIPATPEEANFAHAVEAIARSLVESIEMEISMLAVASSPAPSPASPSKPRRL